MKMISRMDMLEKCIMCGKKLKRGKVDYEICGTNLGKFPADG